MAVTFRKLLPGETATWTIKIRRISDGVQVGTSGGAAGTYNLLLVAGALYRSVSVGYGTEPGAVTSGNHIVETYAPGSTVADQAVTVNVIDGADISLDQDPEVPATTTEIVSTRSTSTIEFFVGELAPYTHPAVDSTGAAITLTGLTLEIIVEDKKASDVIIILAASITISGSNFTFTPTAAMTATPRNLLWALRDATTKSVIVSGVMPVSYAAEEGTPVVSIWDGGAP